MSCLSLRLFRYKALIIFGTICLLFSLKAYAIRASIREAPITSSYLIECIFNDDQSIDCINEERYLILKENGKNILSAISYDIDDFKQIQLLVAQYQNQGEDVKSLNKKYVQQKDSSNNIWLDNKKKLILVFPELKVGSRLRIRYKEHINAVSFNSKATWSYMFLNDNQYIQSFNVYIKSNTPLYYYKQNFEDFTIVNSDDKKIVQISLNKPKYEYYINEPYSYFRNPARVMISQSSNINEYYAGLAKYYNNILLQQLPEKANQFIESIKHLPVKQQIYKVLEYVYINYRYVGDWKTSLRGWIPFDLFQIEEHGYGDCKDLSILVVAMLNRLNIDAKPVLVFRGINSLPLLGLGNDVINHAIVKVILGKDVLWIDPTNYFYDDGNPNYDISDRWAITIEHDNKVILDFIPPEQKDIFTSNVTIDFYNEQPFLSITNLEKGARIKQFRDIQINDGLYTFKDFYCDSFFYLVGDQCRLKFPKIGFNINKNYIFYINGEDLKVLQPISNNKYIFYDINNFFGFLDIWQRYIKNKQSLDLLMNVILKVKNINLRNMTVQDNIKNCRVNSPWVYIEVNGNSIPQGYNINYVVEIKKKWLSRREIMSSEFQDILLKLMDCSQEANIIVKKIKT